MKFQLPAKELAHALTGLTKVISPHATLPILRGVRVEARDSTVTLTATDLDCSVTYTCKSAEVQEPGSTVIADAKRLKSAVQNAKTEGAVVHVINDDAVEVGLHGPKGDRIHVLVALPKDDWPDSPQAIKTESVDPLFLEHYRMLLPFSSTDSTRHILQSVCCEKTKEGQLMVATDGRRLTTANSISFPLSKTAIIPRNKFLTDLAVRNGYAVSDLNRIAGERFGVTGIYNLDRKQASRLIDELSAVKKAVPSQGPAATVSPARE